MDGMNRYLLYKKAITKDEEIIEKVIETVIEVFNTTEENIMGGMRNRWLGAYPRYCISNLSQNLTDITLKETGSIINVDHSSIIHHNKVVPNLLHEQWGCPEFKGKYKRVCEQLYDKWGIKLRNIVKDS